MGVRQELWAESVWQSDFWGVREIRSTCYAVKCVVMVSEWWSIALE